jgi:hypothetical protein
MPNMPCSSGPVRKELGSIGLFMPYSSIDAPGKGGFPARRRLWLCRVGGKK